MTIKPLLRIALYDSQRLLLLCDVLCGTYIDIVMITAFLFGVVLVWCMFCTLCVVRWLIKAMTNNSMYHVEFVSKDCLYCFGTGQRSMQHDLTPANICEHCEGTGQLLILAEIQPESGWRTTEIPVELPGGKRKRKSA